MTRFDSPLNNIKIASPCSADWNEMYGNERKRFCGDCKLNVYNLSGMTSYDAENLLRNSEGRMCVRFFRRADGTILTSDCPVGWAKVKQRLTASATAVFSLVLALFSGVFFASLSGKRAELGELIPMPLSTPKPELLMGAVAMPSPIPKDSVRPAATMVNIVVPKELKRPDANRQEM